MESDLKHSRELEGLPFNTWPYKAPTAWKDLDLKFEAEDLGFQSQKVLEEFE